jgi:hypothetical protein
MDWIDLAQDWGPVECSFEHGNELSVSVECWEILLHNPRLLKKGSAP